MLMFMSVPPSSKCERISAFKQDAAVLDQFFRQVTPNIGAFDAEIATASVAAGLEKTGPTVLVTHSQGGGVGWLRPIGCI